MDTKKLRQKILDLAIHGKLVPQDPNDEPASVLLQRIRTEKERLIKEGKIKRSRKSVKTSDTPHYPYELPEGWVWCKLDDLAFYKKGPFGSSLTKAMFVPKGDDTYKVYEQKNAIQKDCTLGTYYISKEKYDSLFGFAVQPFDIIVSCAGTIGETYVLPQHIKKGIINQALMLIRLYCREIEQFYLLYFDFILKEEANTSSKGTAIKNIPPFDVLKNFYIPIPPLKEQRRILDEVNKWLSFVESVETSTLNLQDTIKQTKSKILDLAIHGKLVPQNPADEPASELLKRINPKAEIACDNEHYPHLPKGWCTCRLEEVFDMLMGQSPEGGSINSSEGIEFHQGKIFFTEKFLSKSHYYTSEPIRVSPANSLLLCVRAPVGAVNLSLSDVCIGRGLCSLHPKECLELQYAFYCLTTYQNLFEQQSTGSTFKSISKDIIRNQDFALPPLAEQKRIVEKIEQLFRLLEQIDENL